MNSNAAAREPEPLLSEGFASDIEMTGRTVKGFGIVLFSQIFKLVMQLLAMIAFARLVRPADFGTFSIVSAIAAFALLFKDGLALATVQRAQLSECDKNNLFWTTCTLGACAAFITAAVGPKVQAVYGNENLAQLLLLMCLYVLLSYLSNQPLALLRRDMRFKVLAIIEQIATVVGLATGLGLALLGGGVFSLAAVPLVMAVVTFFAAWATAGWLPGLPRRASGFHLAASYGKHVILSDLATYAVRNVDTFLIGWWCGLKSLGFYDKAYNLMMIPLQQLLSPAGTVAHSALSASQNTPERFTNYACKIIMFTAVLGMCASGFLFVTAENLVPTLLGAGWISSAVILKALAPAAFFDAIIMGPSLTLLAKANTKEYLQLKLAGAVLGIAAFFAGAPSGVLGIALAFSLSRGLLALLTVYLCNKVHSIGPQAVGKSLQTPLLVAVVPAIIVEIFFRGRSGLPVLFCQFFSFCALALALWLVSAERRHELRELLELLTKGGHSTPLTEDVR